MLSFCLKCRRNFESKNQKVAGTKNRRRILLSKCAVYVSKKSKFIKDQGASGLLSSLRIKKPLSKIPLLGPLSFLVYKMNEIVNKLLLAEDKSIPEMFLRPGFIYSVCRPFTKNKERIRKFKEAGDSPYIYENELDKACFQHDMAYGNFKDLTRRTIY